MDPTPTNPWVSPLAKWCVLLTFALIFVGAIVTTAGAGMAAPTAPHVDGTLINPISPVTKTAWWKDPALFKEHTHRLIAISLGLSVGALAALLWRNWPAFFIAVGFMGIAAEGGRRLGWPEHVLAHVRIWPAMIIFVALLIWTARKRREKPGAEQWMVLIAYVAACLQALFGTLRVEIETAGHIELATNIRVVHGVFAQAFLALLVVLAARLSPAYQQIGTRPEADRLKRSAFSLLILYFIQLACAAYLRHRHLGLLIPTWPAAQATGGLWMDAWSVADGALRHQLAIHFLHTRIIPILILGHSIGMAIAIAKRASGERRLTRPGWGILGLVLLQIVLGVLVIWKGRHAHITNTHVMIGALICATTALLYARARRCAQA
jgi:heme a synthase